MIKADKDSVLFSFGGIGSTPDDLTREIASKIFREKPLQTHEQFKQDILKKFANEAYPHRIHMADLPPNSELIFNPINNMSGFSLDKRFFFVPGFPMMAHPMLSEIIKKYFGKKEIKFRKTLLAQTSENTLISIMQKIPSDIELSSLPIFKEGKPSVELSLSYKVESVLEKYFSFFTNELENLNIPYTSNK